MKQRLQKIIAQAGLASRRAAETMIAQGRVSVNGTVVVTPGTTADPERDSIIVDGIPLEPRHPNIYLLLHKPTGCITSLHDPEGRPTVMQFLTGVTERLFPVGRLDYDTEGLLVLTNDGAFANLLLHPRHGFDRTYAVKVKGEPSAEGLERLRSGLTIEGIRMKARRVVVVKRTKKNTWIEIVLSEGRNRQIKKMLEAVGCRTLRIIRTGFGPLTLGDVPPGSWRQLTREEVQRIEAAARRASGATAQT